MNAIVGSTASGKSALAFYLACKYKLDIFSIDSLSVYKYIDIASAKPSKAELSHIKHYGIDVLNPDEKCNAKVFFDLLNSLSQKRLIIVGGSSFYLKSMLDGLSKIPQSNKEISKYVESLLIDKHKAYKKKKKIDESYTSKIHQNDVYRIAKGLEIYFLTGKSPSVFFMENKNIVLDRDKILNSVWNYDYFGDARTIDTHVKKLRSKLGEADYIKTIWGLGYKFSEDSE